MGRPLRHLNLSRVLIKKICCFLFQYSSFWCGSSKYHRRAVSINGKGEDPPYRPIQRSNLPVIFRQLTHITALNICIIICNSKQLYLHNLHTLEEGNKPTHFFSTTFKWREEVAAMTRQRSTTLFSIWGSLCVCAFVFLGAWLWKCHYD